MNILVCYDNSPFSKIALKKAVDYHKKLGGKISVIHVLDENMFLIGKNNLFPEANKAIATAQEMISKILQKTHDDLKSKKINLKIVIKKGNIIDEITKYAKKNKIELIIIGNLGTGVSRNLKLGGIATKLSQSAPCDLLITR